ncbi:MAG: RHS repeat-associated core domain-containing protein [Nanoarchaeota archaeon]
MMKTHFWLYVVSALIVLVIGFSLFDVSVTNVGFKGALKTVAPPPKVVNEPSPVDIGNDPLPLTQSGETTVYIYGNGRLIAKDTGDDLVRHHQDYLGSNRISTHTNGIIISKTTQYPYGKDLDSVGTKEGLDNNYKFTGQEQDDTNLYYYGARYYRPDLGRFLSVDPKGSTASYDYANGNPLKYVDPSGRTAAESDATAFTSGNQLFFNEKEGYWQTSEVHVEDISPRIDPTQEVWLSPEGELIIKTPSSAGDLPLLSPDVSDIIPGGKSVGLTFAASKFIGKLGREIITEAGGDIVAKMFRGQIRGALELIIEGGVKRRVDNMIPRGDHLITARIRSTLGKDGEQELFGIYLARNLPDPEAKQSILHLRILDKEGTAVLKTGHNYPNLGRDMKERKVLSNFNNINDINNLRDDDIDPVLLEFLKESVEP